MSWNCSLVAPIGILAVMSKRSLSSHLGPLSWHPLTLYALVKMFFNETFVYVSCPGSGVPGPPLIRTRIIPMACGSAGLTDATSKVGDSVAACPKAAHEVRMIRQIGRASCKERA